MLESYLTVTVFLISVIILLIYLYLTWNFNYWKKRGVNGPKPKILYGTFPSIFTGKRNMYYDMLDIYSEFKATERLVGVFSVREPEILILDPALAHEIYVTKFRYFNENAVAKFVDKKIDKIFGRNPFILQGAEWKEIRNDVAPALTVNRIKASYPVIQKTCEKLISHINSHNLTDINHVFDAKLLFSRYTVETVSDCIFGIESGAFNEKKESVVFKAAQNLITEFVSNFAFFFMSNLLPFIKLFKKTRFMGEKTENFFIDLTHKAIKMRLQNKSDRCDYLNYILQLKEKKNLNDIDVAAQTMTFFTDGFETSSLLITHCALMLGRHKDVQEKLRQEILSNLDSNGDVIFEKLIDMPYLDAVCSETLRNIASILFGSKRCTETIEFDNNGKTARIEKGMIVHVPIQCFQTDENYYDNADKFIPERFLNEDQGKKWKDEGKFLPFGDGPRICLGMKFGLAQSKAAICTILKHFEITVNKKTRNDNYFSNQDLIPMIEGGVWLSFKNLN